MKTLKVKIADITKTFNESTKGMCFDFKREGFSFIGKSTDSSEDKTDFQKSLRRSSIKAYMDSLKKDMKSIGLDIDWTSGIDGQDQKYFIRVTVKDLPEQETKEESTPNPKSKKTLDPNAQVEPKAPKGPGVLSTILELIKEGPQTQQSILDKLVFAFPDRTAEAMKKTITAQLGGYKKGQTRMEQEKSVKFSVTTDEKGVPTYTFVPAE